MCIFPKSGGTKDPPPLPQEPQQAQLPTVADTAARRTRTKDQLRAGMSTILTSGSGLAGASASSTGPTVGKTLLGQ